MGCFRAVAVGLFAESVFIVLVACLYLAVEHFSK
jgi:hypothetical protein